MSSTTVNMQNMEAIDYETKMTVLGFVRMTQSCLSPNTLFSNIPSLITRIILCYAQQPEIFHSISGSIQLSDNKRTIKEMEKSVSAWSAAYGTIGIPSTSKIRCYWKIKIDKRENNMFIGLTSASKRKSKRWMHEIDTTVFKHVFYCLFCLNNRQMTDTMGLRKMYAKQRKGIKTGDEVTMYLDMKQETISFAVNGIDYGNAFTYIRSDDETTYYLALSVIGLHAQMTISEFGYF